MEGIRLLKMQFRPAPTPAKREKIRQQLNDFFNDLNTIFNDEDSKPSADVKRRSELTDKYIDFVKDAAKDPFDAGELVANWRWYDAAHLVYSGETLGTANWNILRDFLFKEFQPYNIDWIHLDDGRASRATVRGMTLAAERLLPLDRKDWALLQSLLRQDGQTRSKELLAWMKAIDVKPH